MCVRVRINCLLACASIGWLRACFIRSPFSRPLPLPHATDLFLRDCFTGPPGRPAQMLALPWPLWTPFCQKKLNLLARNGYASYDNERGSIRYVRCDPVNRDPCWLLPSSHTLAILMCAHASQSCTPSSSVLWGNSVYCRKPKQTNLFVNSCWWSAVCSREHHRCRIQGPLQPSRTSTYTTSAVPRNTSRNVSQHDLIVRQIVSRRADRWDTCFSARCTPCVLAAAHWWHLSVHGIHGFSKQPFFTCIWKAAGKADVKTVLFPLLALSWRESR